MLRAATRGAHDRVDALFADFDLGRAGDYRRFLEAQASAFLPTEDALAEAGAERIFPGWSEMRRGHLLRADLADLGLMPLLPVPAPALASPAAIAGAAYVVEGSRMGGAMLVRRVAPDLPRRFLSAAFPAGGWRAFLGRLEQVLPTDVERREAIAAACATFALFARLAVPLTKVP